MSQTETVSSLNMKLWFLLGTVGGISVAVALIDCKILASHFLCELGKNIQHR